MGHRTLLVLSTQPGERPGIIGWFRRHHPEVNEATLAAHIQAATINAANRAQNNPLGTRAALLRRIDHGLHVRTTQLQKPAAHGAVPVSAQELTGLRGGAPDLVLIGCVRTKLAAAATVRQPAVCGPRPVRR